jgi:oxygen-independent coproporphyrinogen-3 oxidase
MNHIALYIHFPYCLYKCHYCDFNSYAVEGVEGVESNYTDALLAELETTLRHLPRFVIPSIFLGGGTPSLFSPHEIGRLLNQVAKNTSISSDCEVTIEVNPKTLTAEKVDGYLKEGIRRFSVGVQSFENRYLIPLGRLHTGEEAMATLRLLRKKGVENLSFDLMFGFPGQTAQEVMSDLQKALSIEPQHLSFYNLTLEEGTLLKDQWRKGKIQLPENEVQAEMYEQGIRFLEDAGYCSYEISNFARSGYESRHNLAYWRYQDYLGLGAGAVSFLRKELIGDGLRFIEEEEIYGYRWTNPLTPKEYIAFVKESLERQGPPLPNPLPPGERGPGKPPLPWRERVGVRGKNEIIDIPTAKGEFFMMGLRLKEGISISEFERRFGEGSFLSYQEIIPPLQAKGWLIREEDHLLLTREGRFFANDVVSCFLL